MEQIAKRQIESFVGLNDIIYGFNNTGASLIGGYFKDGIVNTIVRKEEESTEFVEWLFERYKNKFSKPTGVANTAQKTYQGASQAVSNGIDMVKDSAKEIKNTAKGLIKNILK